MGVFQSISPVERRDLVIAWIAISLAFMILFVRSAFTRAGGLEPLIMLFFFLTALLTVGVAFVLHELAHKYSAMHYGFWAEFRMDPGMLVVAVAMAVLVGIVFAAPGATMISGYSITKRQNGIISAWGPATNLILLVPFAGIFAAGSVTGDGLISLLGLIGLQVNAMIAAFNMLPVGNLDGSKILAWNPVIFIVMIAVSFAVLYLVLTSL
ncbi:MAG: peptidase M50 [Methanospirillaceae archaeon]|nr:peptidase M50 [Methanospirillaceae archaeon]